MHSLTSFRDVTTSSDDSADEEPEPEPDTKKAKPAKKPKAAAAPPPPPAPSKKLTYKDQRDYDLLPARIEELDRQIARDEALLADPDMYTKNHARFAALTAAVDKARAEKDAAEMRWLELAEMVEGLG